MANPLAVICFYAIIGLGVSLGYIILRNNFRKSVKISEMKEIMA